MHPFLSDFTSTTPLINKQQSTKKHFQKTNKKKWSSSSGVYTNTSHTEKQSKNKTKTIDVNKNFASKQPFNQSTLIHTKFSNKHFQTPLSRQHPFASLYTIAKKKNTVHMLSASSPSPTQ